MNIRGHFTDTALLKCIIFVFLSAVILLPVALFAQWRIIDDYDNTPRVPAKPVEFYRENISMKIHGTSLELKGIYYFRNNTGQSKNLPIVYPFPVDEFHSVPESVAVFFDDGQGSREIEYGTSKSGETVHFILPVAPGDKNVMTVFYRQKLKGKKARYILTTTSAWGRPFDYAEYHIYVPSDFDSVSVNYPCSTEVKDGEEHYHFSGRNFMPDKDLIVHWRRIAAKIE